MRAMSSLVWLKTNSLKEYEEHKKEKLQEITSPVFVQMPSVQMSSSHFSQKSWQEEVADKDVDEFTVAGKIGGTTPNLTEAASALYSVSQM